MKRARQHLELPTIIQSSPPSFTRISPQSKINGNYLYHVFFCLYSHGLHNYNVDISIMMVSGIIAKKNMKITTNYTAVTNCYHNLIPNLLVSKYFPWETYSVLMMSSFLKVTFYPYHSSLGSSVIFMV